MDSDLEKIRSILEEIQVSIDWGYEIKKIVLNETKYRDSMNNVVLGCPVEFNEEVQNVKMEIFGETTTFFIYK